MKKRFVSGLRYLMYQLTRQYTGVALLTIVPFIISGLIFEPFDTATLDHIINDDPYVYKLPVAIALLVWSILVALRQKSTAFIACILSAATLCVMAAKHQGLFKPDQPDWQSLYIIYTLTSLLTFFVIAGRPTFSTTLFRGITLLLLLDVLAGIFAPKIAVLTPLFVTYFPSKVSVILCLITLALLRMIWKFHQENAETRRQVNAVHPQFIKKVRFKTLHLWWPMLFVFVLCTAGYQLAQDRYIHQPLISHLNGLGYTKTQKPANSDKVFDTVETASQAAIDRLSKQHANNTKLKIDKQIKTAGNKKTAVIQGVENSLPKRFPGTKKRDCGFGDVNCGISNLAKDIINSAYISNKGKMLRNLRRRLDKLEADGKNTAANVKALVDDTFNQFTRATNRRITHTAMGLRYFSIAALIYGILILCKSLMIVFARVFYARMSTALTQKNIKSTENDIDGTMQKAGHRFTLTRDDGYDHYYVNFRYCGNNVIDRRRIPQILTLIIKRIFTKNYAMCAVDLVADKTVSACDIIVDPPAEIVVWDMVPGDEVFLDMRALVGFSKGCRLGRTISLSLGSLIFGRAIYYSVKPPKNGTGRLFIRTLSAPIAADDEDCNNVMQSSSLVAWQSHTRFNVISALTKSDTFFSSYSIRKFDKKPHLVIFDTSQKQRIGTGQGIMKMARSFLWPF